MKNEPLKIAIAGLGTVGCGVLNLLSDNGGLISKRTSRDIKVVAVSSRDKNKDRGVDLSGITWCDDAVDLTKIDEVDVIVELIGGSEGKAKELVEAAINSGKSVVSANKALFATHGYNLAKLAEDNEVSLLWEAAVAGGIPIIKTLKEGFCANEVQKVTGILNGTCNYILTRMEESGDSFDVALKAAQDLGYAEADPTFDIGGMDAGHKISLLSAIAFGEISSIDKMKVDGIGDITDKDIGFASELGYVIRLLGNSQMCDDGQVSGGVEPCLVLKNSPFASVHGADNAIMITANPVGDSMSIGQGAGAGATASAVMADVIDIAKNTAIQPTFGIPIGEIKQKQWRDCGQDVSKFYLNLSVKDTSGVVLEISLILKEHGISISSLLQHGRNVDEKVSLIITTHETTRAAVEKACRAFDKLDVVLEKTKRLRIF